MAGEKGAVIVGYEKYIAEHHPQGKQAFSWRTWDIFSLFTLDGFKMYL